MFRMKKAAWLRHFAAAMQLLFTGCRILRQPFAVLIILFLIIYP